MADLGRFRMPLGNTGRLAVRNPVGGGMSPPRGSQQCRWRRRNNASQGHHRTGRSVVMQLNDGFWRNTLISITVGAHPIPIWGTSPLSRLGTSPLPRNLRLGSHCTPGLLVPAIDRSWRDWALLKGFGESERGWWCEMRLSRLHRPSRLGIPIICLIAMFGALLAASPAGATSTNQPFGPCSATVNNGVCISAVSADYTSTTITLGITVGQATDPTTDPNWDPANFVGSNATGVIWNVYVNGSTTPAWTAGDVDVDNQSGPPTFAGGVEPYLGDTLACSAAASFGISTDSYVVSFPASCIGNPTSIAVVAAWAYADGSTQYEGEAPDGGTPCCSVTPGEATPTPTPPPTPTPTPVPTGQHGYWLVGSDGGIFSFGSAMFYGSTGAMKLQRPVVGITPTASQGGYWLVASDGGIFAFGNASYYGSIPGIGLAPAGSANPKRLNAPIVGMVPSSDGGGYFMVAADGGVFTFGDAKFAGSCPGIGGCSGAAVDVMPDASGNGYWLVTTTGHVYAFGDAVNYGAPGPQSVPVTSAVRTTDGDGYWILFSNGTVNAYGDAANLGGPVGAAGGFNPATAIFTTSDGGGYWVASANGSVYNYGDAPNLGSMAGQHLNGSIIAATGK